MIHESDYRRSGIYRARGGIFFGVCKGIARHFDLSVFWTRMTVVLIFVLTGFFPIAFLYAGAALLMKKEPLYRYYL